MRPPGDTVSRQDLSQLIDVRVGRRGAVSRKGFLARGGEVRFVYGAGMDGGCAAGVGARGMVVGMTGLGLGFGGV